MTPEQRMRIYLGECDQHAAVLAEGLAELQPWLPLTASAVQTLSKVQLRVLDQVSYRFTKLQDSMGQKVLPAILDLAQEPIAPDATFAEKLNWLERIGALPAAEEWKHLRIARNALAHEYPDDPELRASAANRFLDGAMRLNALYTGVGGYLRAHFPNLGRMPGMDH